MRIMHITRHMQHTGRQERQGRDDDRLQHLRGYLRGFLRTYFRGYLRVIRSYLRGINGDIKRFYYYCYQRQHAGGEDPEPDALNAGVRPHLCVRLCECACV